jgi:hypothetical protein
VVGESYHPIGVGLVGPSIMLSFTDAAAPSGYFCRRKNMATPSDIYQIVQDILTDRPENSVKDRR